MDYCSSCRRHLNGALVCPGCGAYAPDIAPSAVGGTAVPPGAAATGTAAWETPTDDTWYDGYFRDEAAPSADVEDTAPTSPSGDVEGMPQVPQGRAARRRQRARWKKNQRRAVVATAVALVGGGLTVSALDRGSADKAQAATAPQDPGVVGAEEQATELTRPVSTPPDTREATRTDTPGSKPSPTNVAREPVSTPHTTREFTRPDAASTPSPTATPVPQTQTVSPAPGGATSGDSGGAAAEPQQTPPPTATDSSDSGTSTSPTSPAPEETSPAQLCVLNVLCLG
ncbi:SCO2400 family protein [Streptomyces sp. CA-251387]|uniref:SCO2400 family protein n=1 Tax=Streptomyces sp. CA-251387 TaxID=3240064 RepID=UPI003D9178CD